MGQSRSTILPRRTSFSCNLKERVGCKFPLSPSYLGIAGRVDRMLHEPLQPCSPGLTQHMWANWAVKMPVWAETCCPFGPIMASVASRVRAICLGRQRLPFSMAQPRFGLLSSALWALTSTPPPRSPRTSSATKDPFFFIDRYSSSALYRIPFLFSTGIYCFLYKKSRHLYSWAIRLGRVLPVLSLTVASLDLHAVFMLVIIQKYGEDFLNVGCIQGLLIAAGSFHGGHVLSAFCYSARLPSVSLRRLVLSAINVFIFIFIIFRSVACHSSDPNWFLNLQYWVLGCTLLSRRLKRPMGSSHRGVHLLSTMLCGIFSDFCVVLLYYQNSQFGYCRMSDTDSSNSLDFMKVSLLKSSNSFFFWVHFYWPFNYLVVLQIRYAYELLTNPIWRRNYDIFGIEEQPVRKTFLGFLSFWLSVVIS